MMTPLASASKVSHRRVYRHTIQVKFRFGDYLQSFLLWPFFDLGCG